MDQATKHDLAAKPSKQPDRVDAVPADRVEPAAPVERPRKIRLSLDVTPDMKDIIETLAEEAGTNQGEILRRAIILFRAVKKGEAQGEFPALVKDGKIVAKLVGF